MMGEVNSQTERANKSVSLQNNSYLLSSAMDKVFSTDEVQAAAISALGLPQLQMTGYVQFQKPCVDYGSKMIEMMLKHAMASPRPLCENLVWQQTVASSSYNSSHGSSCPHV